MWVFTRSGSTWTQQGEKLTGGGESGKGEFGFSVALSADGDSALIGGPLDNSGLGAEWVFTRSGSTWTQQGEKLTGGGESGKGQFGFSAALSADGDTALIGDLSDKFGVGAAWVFTRSDATWTQQGSKLTPSGDRGCCEFGRSVALSADGDAALIGAPGDNFPGVEGAGAAWAFTRSGSTWTPHGSKLANPEESELGMFGYVALSGDGNLALIGAPGDNSAAGTAWVFAASPRVQSLSPKKGVAAGETTVTITGTNLTGATAVTFGSTAATSFTVQSASTITAVSPSETAGRVDVTVTTSAGTSAISSHDHFRFEAPTVTALSPDSGSIDGGSTVTVTGSGFALGTGETNVDFGRTPGTEVSCTSNTTCTVLTPLGRRAGTVDVTASVGKAQGRKSPPADEFTYE